MMEISGNTIKAAREHLGWDRKLLAANVNVAESIIRDIENKNTLFNEQHYLNGILISVFNARGIVFNKNGIFTGHNFDEAFEALGLSKMQSAVLRWPSLSSSTGVPEAQVLKEITHLELLFLLKENLVQKGHVSLVVNFPDAPEARSITPEFRIKLSRRGVAYVEYLGRVLGLELEVQMPPKIISLT